MSASGSGHTKMVKLLLEAGADVHATYTYPCAANQTRSGTLLHLAASSGNVAVVRLLLQEGVDVNATGGVRVPYPSLTMFPCTPYNTQVPCMLAGSHLPTSPLLSEL
jgi:hypothetical protein